MPFRSIWTAFVVLLFAIQTMCAVIEIRAVENTIEATAMTMTQSPPIHDAALAPDPPGLEHEGRAIYDLRGSTIDWREDGIHRQESGREAGFLPESYDDVYPSSPWTLIRICIISSIAICILKIAHELRK